MKKKLLYFLLFITYVSQAQDLTQIGKAKLFTLGGGISANSVFYNGDGQREPFTYVLNGNINLNVSGIYNIPISFAYSNQDFGFSQPFRYNRLSLNPSYKWLTAHIGDVSMTFSPYTLSGHQFSGLGIDVTPTSKLKISAMYGRLIRPIEFDEENPQAIPAFKRIGYGVKTAYDFDKFSLGLTLFAASDEENSLENPVPVESGVNPQENLVVSIDGKVKLLGKAILNVEYATSGITEDIRASGNPGNNGPLDILFDGNATTQYYNAVNAQLSLGIGNGSLGINYERVDPGYKTLGAYFFNNDLENIAVNASQTIINNNVNISVNAGLQRDNLDNTKTSELQRVVAAINVSIKASDKLNINGSYSNFQSVTNIRDQFDFINAATPFDNIDTLNFRQLSRNATLNLAYTISKSEKRAQNASINLSMQDTEDLQEQFLSGTQNTVGATTFFNAGGNYTLSFVPIDFNVTAGVNASFNETLETDNTTFGPTLALSKLFFDKKVRSSFAASYNQSSVNGEIQNSVLNFRVNAGYQLYEKHQFNLSLLSLFRNSPNIATPVATNDFTATLGYNYSFSTGGKKNTKQNREQVAQERERGGTYIQFRSKGRIFEGGADALIAQILEQRNTAYFDIAPPEVLQQLDTAQKILEGYRTGEEKDLKEAAIDYLTIVDDYNTFAKAYTESVLLTVNQLEEDATALDSSIEAEYIVAISKIREHPFEGKPLDEITDTSTQEYTNYKTLYEAFEIKSRKLVNHRYMLNRLIEITNARDLKKDTALQRFKKEEIAKAYDAYGTITKSASSLSEVLTVDLIIYYQNLANQFANPNEYLPKIKK